jgi:HAD superfamily hydrolase (TIGR01509 family)
MRLRAVISDFGGVLVRTRDNSGRLKWEQRLDLQPGGLADIVFNSPVSIEATLGKQPEEAIWVHVGEVFNLSPVETKELRQDFWAGDRFDKTLGAFIGGLRPQLKTAILSNAWTDARKTFTQVYHLDRYTDAFIISSEVGIAKPDARIYRTALDRLGVLAEEAIFLDDVEINVRAAINLGLRGIQFENTAQAIRELRALLDGSF